MQSSTRITVGQIHRKEPMYERLQELYRRPITPTTHAETKK